PPARKDLRDNEFDESGGLERQRQAAFLHFQRMQPGDGVQQHDSVVGQQAMRQGEERVVALMPEMLEGADAHDPVDRLVKLLPALQQNSLRARAFGLLEKLPDVI